MTMEKLILPKGYRASLSVPETEKAIKSLKDFFENRLAEELNLMRVSAPLFVTPESGLNDNLNGVERPAVFDVRALGGKQVEIVHSLAKWKRMALKRYGLNHGEGLYTDMNAIRRDEDPDNLHSFYVDQWDWEKIIREEERTEETLRNTVNSIFRVFKDAEEFICSRYPQLHRLLPDEITFLTTQELEDRYPGLDPRHREDAIAKEKKAVCLMKIGGVLKSGIRHDGRAPDYDDWERNCDILFWYPLLDCSFEVSSMGIRVDKEALQKQLKLAGCEERKDLTFHRELLNGDLPCTIGGGIGQSRICMYLLNKAHIGEVQASVWPEEMLKACERANITLL